MHPVNLMVIDFLFLIIKGAQKRKNMLKYKYTYFVLKLYSGGLILKISMKIKKSLLMIIIVMLISIVSTGCSQPKNQNDEEINNKIAQLEESIKKLELEIDMLTKQKADLMLELDSIGVPNKIKYIKGYQGNMEIIKETTFKLMPTDTSEILASLEAGTIVEVLAIGEATTYDPC